MSREKDITKSKTPMRSKKLGRPVTTGPGEAIMLRLQPELLAKVDRLCWRHRMTRQAVIRLLMLAALESGVLLSTQEK